MPTPSQVADVAAVPSGGQAYILLETPDGEVVSLTISPVLPLGHLGPARG